MAPGQGTNLWPYKHLLSTPPPPLPWDVFSLKLNKPLKVLLTDVSHDKKVNKVLLRRNSGSRTVYNGGNRQTTGRQNA